MEEQEEPTIRQEQETSGTVVTGCRWSCQTDASWSESSEWMGLCFVLLEEGVVKLAGHKCCPKASSPLHAEADSLIWALREVSSRLHQRVLFESDCMQLVTLVWKEDVWPIIAPELDEINFLRATFQESLVC